ncbi:MAG TPA: hypothetical protein VGB74_11120 [Actinoplanes sp.]|jgi:hypothetical protein
MSISFSSLASTAFDTARSTFKGLAEAAVQGEAATSAAATAKAPDAVAAPAPAKPVVVQRARLDITESSEATPSSETPKPIKRRVGTLLDSYA